MGLSQIIGLINNSKPDGENPYNTKVGQQVVSVSENFWTRLSREGRFRGFQTEGTVSIANNNSFAVSSVLSPSLGCILYPSTVSVSADVDAELVIVVNTNVKDGDYNSTNKIYHVAWCKAGTPFTVKFDGDIFCLEGGGVNVQARTTIGTGKLYGSINGVEVAVNA